MNGAVCAVCGTTTTTDGLIQDRGRELSVGLESSGVDQLGFSRATDGAIAAESCIAITRLDITTTTTDAVEIDGNGRAAVGQDVAGVGECDVAGVTARASGATEVEDALIDVDGGASTTTTDGLGDDAVGAGSQGCDVAVVNDGDVAGTAALATGSTKAEGALAAANVTAAAADGESKDTDAVFATSEDVSTSVVGDGDGAGFTTGATGAAEGSTYGSGAGEGAAAAADGLGIDAVGSIAADIDHSRVGNGDVACITTGATGTAKADGGISACTGAWGGDADTTTATAN